MKYLVIVILTVLLVGCAANRIPDDLLTPCNEVQKRAVPVQKALDEAARLANSRLESIEQCNKKIEKIRSILKNK